MRGRQQAKGRARGAAATRRALGTPGAVRAAVVAVAAVGGLGACAGSPAGERASEDAARDSSRQRAIDLGAVGAPPRAKLIKHGPRRDRLVALTFDADMTPAKLAELRVGGAASTWYDPRVVEELRRTRTPATFFLTGLWARVHPHAARQLARSRQFQIENHSFSHRAFKVPCFGLEPVASKPEKRAEVVRSRRIIARLTGQRTRLFRFPGGCHSKADLRSVAAAGEQPLGWDVVSGDVGQPDPEVVARNVLRDVRPGSIVVMHVVGAPLAPATAAALKRVIPELRARDYRFVTLRQLLGRRGADAPRGGGAAAG
jgi:peptidoglycan-N-acetylglucosamine deacetylase